jgi:hypothetical protein
MSVTSGTVCFLVGNEIERTCLSLILCIIIVKKTSQRTCIGHCELCNRYLISAMFRLFEFTSVSSEDCLSTHRSISLSSIWGITEPKLCRGSYTSITGAAGYFWVSSCGSTIFVLFTCDFVSMIVQQDAPIYSLLYVCKLLCMFRVATPPIIRSTRNCNYNIWHLSNRLYYLPLWWRSGR